MTGSAPILAAKDMKDAARQVGFPLVGLAPAAALDPGPLDRWLAAGHAADMTWIFERKAERLDPRVVLEGAQTVVALAIPFSPSPDPDSMVASYARGRDYHYTHRERLKALRKAILRLDPGTETYACVDTGAAMEKPWAERAGVGFIGKNGCLITPEHGSRVTLSVMFLNRAVDVYDQPAANLCGECTICLKACPTDAFPSPGVVDSRRCVSYQTIENRPIEPPDPVVGFVPLPLRPRMRGHVFGCDVCQDVCPFNRRPLPPGDARFAPRPLALLAPDEIAALTVEEYARLSPGAGLVRAGYNGLRRNALFAMGIARARKVRPLLERLTSDPHPNVAEAAQWVLNQIDEVP